MPSILMAFRCEWRPLFHRLPLWYWLTSSSQSQTLSRRDHCLPSSSEPPWEETQNYQRVKVAKNLSISESNSFLLLAEFSPHLRSAIKTPNVEKLSFFPLQFFKTKTCAPKYFHAILVKQHERYHMLNTEPQLVSKKGKIISGGSFSTSVVPCINRCSEGMNTVLA